MTRWLCVAGCLLVTAGAACSGGAIRSNPSGTGGSPTGGAAPSGSAGTPGGGSAGAPGSGGPAGAPGSGGSPTSCTTLPAIPRRLLALQTDQFGNATRDLLALPGAPQVNGIQTFAGAQASLTSITPSYLYALYVTAGNIVAQVAPRAAALAACAAMETDADCATRFAQTFGRKAFRRALDDVEVADMMKVFAAVCPGPATSCGSPADFADAIGLMVKAFILAPSFLYRTELGPRDLTASATGVVPDTALTPDEVATQLAFVLLDSTPDAELLAAADSGALATPAGVLAQVNRLLALPAVQTNVDDVVARWLGIDLLSMKVKDPALLGPLPASDRDQTALTTELRASWDRGVAATLWSSPAGKLTDLLTSQTFFADWRLATLYGLPAPVLEDPTFSETVWPAVQPRAGILTHPAFLWAVSDPSLTAVVKRGVLIHDDVVCQDPVPSEPDLTTPEAMAVIGTGDSEATISDARLAAGKLCADNCHSELDPYGRLLHAFDPAGGYRTVDEAGRPIDTTMTLTANSPLGAMTVSGPVAFAQALISSKVFAGCAVQRLFEATVAVPVTARNTCQVNDLRAVFDQSDGTMASLIRTLATSDFAHARAGGTL